MSIASRRVAFFIPSLAGGGAERAFVTLSNGFAARGLPVELVTASAEGIFREKIAPQVNLVDLRAGRVLAALPRLVAYLRRARPAALIVAQTHANLVAMLAARLSGWRGRVILTEHHALCALDERGLNRRERLALPLVRLLYPRADAVVGVSSGVADDAAAVAGLPCARVRVIHNPIVTPELLRLAQLPPAHPWLLDGGAPVLLSAGRLVAAKDFETLLRAFAILRAAQPCRLLILGEGPDRPRLDALAAQLGVSADSALPGFDPNPYAAMRCTGVYASTSRREGLPTAIVEALACGAPVVATDCPHGVAEVLENGCYGRLAPVGDAPALAEAILAALRQPHDPAAGQRRAQDFSLDRALDAYLALLAELGA